MGIVNTERENLLAKVAYNYDKARSLDLQDPVLYALGETIGEAVAEMESTTQEMESPEESEDKTIHGCKTCRYLNVITYDSSGTQYYKCMKGWRPETSSTNLLYEHCSMWEGSEDSQKIETP